MGVKSLSFVDSDTQIYLFYVCVVCVSILLFDSVHPSNKSSILPKLAQVELLSVSVTKIIPTNTFLKNVLIPKTEAAIFHLNRLLKTE